MPSFFLLISWTSREEAPKEGSPQFVHGLMLRLLRFGVVDTHLEATVFTDGKDDEENKESKYDPTSHGVKRFCMREPQPVCGKFCDLPSSYLLIIFNK